MNRIPILSFAVVIFGTGTMLATSATSQSGGMKNVVQLQPTSPGTSQSGHVNISGVLSAGGFAGNGANLTSLNASNLTTGTLSAERLPVPLNLSGTTNGGVAQFTNSSASTAASGVFGRATSGSGATYGVHGVSDSPDGVGVIGESTNASGFTFGVKGVNQSSSIGGGILGSAEATTGFTFGVYGRTYSTSGVGVYGNGVNSSGAATGVFGETSGPGGIGVYGSANSLSGINYGGSFTTNSPSGTGVRGTATSLLGLTYAGYFINASSGGYSVFASNTAPSGSTRGVFSQVRSSDGFAVYGQSIATSGFSIGGYFESASNVGRGVHGVATSTTGNATGVSGTAASPSGSGVFGESTNTGNGVAGFALSGGVGVLGQSNTNGIHGISSVNWASGVYAENTGSGFGLAGNSAAPGWAVYAFGNSGTSGTKSFRIDHPLDPENKYLIHYSSESPEPINFYTGNITTDSQGSAWVQLPEYFESINRDFRYTLTVVDNSDSEEFVQVKVAREIEGNRFKIRTSAGHVKVSWRIDAARNDLYVQKYGAPVETEKSNREKGTYQHPELYEEHESKSIPAKRVGVPNPKSFSK